MKKGLALATFTALVLGAFPAFADHRAPRTGDSNTLDLAHVSSIAVGRTIRFRASFQDSIAWNQRPVVGFQIESRGGDGLDRFIFIQRRGGQPICRVYSQHRFIARLDPVVTDDSVACRVERPSLGSNGTAIRWRTTSVYTADVSAIADLAPDDGMFPHI